MDNRDWKLVVKWYDEALRHEQAASEIDAEADYTDFQCHLEAARVYRACAKDLQDAINPPVKVEEEIPF